MFEAHLRTAAHLLKIQYWLHSYFLERGWGAADGGGLHRNLPLVTSNEIQQLFEKPQVVGNKEFIQPAGG